MIQFCPDLDRGEHANVGVVLAVPRLEFLDVRLAPDNQGPARRFGADAFDDALLTLAKRGILGRIREEGPAWRDAADLARFARKEGNSIQLSAPRTILVENPEPEIEELFRRLVHVHPRPDPLPNGPP